MGSHFSVNVLFKKSVENMFRNKLSLGNRTKGLNWLNCLEIFLNVQSGFHKMGLSLTLRTGLDGMAALMGLKVVGIPRF